MNIQEKVIKIFASVFQKNENDIKITDTKESIESWDSINHLQLIIT